MFYRERSASGVASRFLDELERLGAPTSGVRVFTSLGDYLATLERLCREDPGCDPRLLDDAWAKKLEEDKESVWATPRGDVVVYLAEEADHYTFYHALGHVWVLKRIGVAVRGRMLVALEPMAPTDPGSRARAVEKAVLLGSIYAWLAANILEDALADLAMRRMVGEEFWLEAVEENGRGTLEGIEKLLTLFPADYVSWLEHLVEAVYMGRATCPERRAIKAYTERPSRETALGLVESLVRSADDFGVILATRREERRELLVFWVEPLLRALILG